MKKTDTKKLAVLAMLCALAYIIVAFVRIPAALFLKYEPKDVVITIGGFLYGPFASLAMSVVVSFIEMITISDTGWIGFAMNVLSTAAFACTASLIYKKKHTLSGAVLGMVIGTIMMTVVMVAWNYVLTPIYMETPRSEVASMLLPVFLPFNLIKGILNAAITALLFRPLVQTLRKANLFPQSQNQKAPSAKHKLWFYIFAAVSLLVGIAWMIYKNI